MHGLPSVAEEVWGPRAVHLRKALHMLALVAMRVNSALRTFTDRLRRADKRDRPAEDHRFDYARTTRTASAITTPSA